MFFSNRTTFFSLRRMLYAFLNPIQPLLPCVLFSHTLSLSLSLPFSPFLPLFSHNRTSFLSLRSIVALCSLSFYLSSFFLSHHSFSISFFLSRSLFLAHSYPFFTVHFFIIKTPAQFLFLFTRFFSWFISLLMFSSISHLVDSHNLHFTFSLSFFLCAYPSIFNYYFLKRLLSLTRKVIIVVLSLVSFIVILEHFPLMWTSFNVKYILYLASCSDIHRVG